MKDCFVFDISPDGHSTRTELNAALPKTGYRWISGSPEDEAIAAWCAKHLPDLVTQALLQSETRPRALAHEAGVVLILRGVNLNPDANVDDMVSVRTYTQPGLIITLRHRTVFALRAIQNEVENGAAPHRPQLLLQKLSDELVTRLESVSLQLDEQVYTLEEALLDSAEPPAVMPELATLRRKTIRLRRYAAPLATALRDMARLMEHTPPIAALFAESANHALRSVEELEATRERLTALVDHLEMQNAVRQQHNGYLLSVIAAIFLPLGFLSGLFGVNVAGMPGTEWAPAFWLLAGLSLLCAIAMAAILRYLRWF